MIKSGKCYITVFDIKENNGINRIIDGNNPVFDTISEAINSAVIDVEEDEDGDSVVVYEVSIKPVRSAKLINPKVAVEVLK